MEPTGGDPAVPSFSQATDVTPRSSHTYSADFSSHWCVGTVPHGGYVTSCFQRAAACHFSTTLRWLDQHHCMTLHLEFLRRTSVGPALFTVKDLELGNRTSTIHVALLQQDGSSQGREEAVAYLTHTNLDKESGLSIPNNFSLANPKPAPLDFSALASDSDPNWACARTLPFSEFRHVYDRVHWLLPRHGQITRGCVDQWFSLQDGRERFTNESLGFVADLFMQMIETLLDPNLDILGRSNDRVEGKGIPREPKVPRAKYWYPTVLLNMEVKKNLPACGVDWLFSRIRTKQIKNGRYDLSITILDEQGDLVCLSQHVCLAVSAQRNLKARQSFPDAEKGQRMAQKL